MLLPKHATYGPVDHAVEHADGRTKTVANAVKQADRPFAHIATPSSVLFVRTKEEVHAAILALNDLYAQWDGIAAQPRPPQALPAAAPQPALAGQNAAPAGAIPQQLPGAGGGTRLDTLKNSEQLDIRPFNALVALGFNTLEDIVRSGMTKKQINGSRGLSSGSQAWKQVRDLLAAHNLTLSK
jgi:hypothetical protein